MPERTIYTAGPMTGIPDFNFPAFHEVARLLRNDGWTVVCPAEHDEKAGFDPTLNTLAGFDLAEAFRWDFMQITECTAIALLPGWEASKGARCERQVAELCGLDIYFVDPDLKGYRLAEAVAPLHDPPTSGETRVTDPDTGGEKGQKRERFDLLPAGPLRQVAGHFGRGAEKYEDRNWERGYAWSLSFAALQRHAWAFWSGEDLDPETQTAHMAAVCFHALALLEFANTHPEKDDRP